MATQVTLGSGVVDSASGLKLRTNGSTEAVDISTGQVATLAQNPILTSGTANGVAYLNGSKVVTTGSALTFDGTNLSVGSGSGSPVLKISGANTSGAGPYLQFLRGGSQTNIIGPYSIVASGTSNDLTYYTTTGYGHVWFSNGQASTINMQLDASGNLGLGATPSAWDSSILTAFQVRSGSVSSVPSGLNDMYVTSNAYYNGGWKYINTATATQYRQSNGHQWLLAASGTAGNAITFTQAMTLTANGSQLLGTTTEPTSRKTSNTYQAINSAVIEGTPYTTVSTTPVQLSRSSGVGIIAMISGYNTSGGAQGTWLVLAGNGVAIVVSSSDATATTPIFAVNTGYLTMQTTTGTLSVVAQIFTGA